MSQKRRIAAWSKRRKTWLPRCRDFTKPALSNSLMCREQVGCDKGRSATISMHATSPRPANKRRIRIRAGCDKARANPAKSTKRFSNTSSFARAMYCIFEIYNIFCKEKFPHAL